VAFVPDTVAFKAAHTAADHWAYAAKACVDSLAPLPPGANLGFVYATDRLAEDFGSILAYLRQKTGIEHWVGSVGIGICGNDAEYFDRPGLAVLVGAIPEESFRIFPSLAKGTDELSGEIRAWMKRAPSAFGVVHADPENAEAPRLLQSLAAEGAGFIVGGLTSSRGALYQIAGRVTGGGVSGVLFAPGIAVATGQTQGCAPAGPVHTVTDAVENVVVALDGRKPIEVLKEDLGIKSTRALQGQIGSVHAAFPIEGSDTGDYAVRTLVGADPVRGWLAVGGPVAAGDRIMFVRRDPKSAESDLVRMVESLKRRVGGRPKAGLYISCIARGMSMFGREGREIGLIREQLGDFPLAGFYAGGEISNARLYGYTGVLVLFL
jgi:small ligand-binding sensory domain FIST